MAELPTGAVAVTRCLVPPQKIACGFYHTLAISNSEHENKVEAWCWGQNQHNVCGLQRQDLIRESKKSKDNTGGQDVFGVRPAPTRVSVLKTDIYEVACGTNHSVFLKKKPDEPGGVLYASGLGVAGRVGIRNPNAMPGETEDIEEQWCTEDGPIQVQFKWASGTRVLRVCCGADHTLCFATDRRLYAWGCNGEGQCGVGGTKNVRDPTPLAFSNHKAILHFACGAQHSLAAAGDFGELWVWGCGRNGRHGLGVKKDVHQPTQVVEVAEEKMVFVAGGEAHSGTIDASGQVWMWGAGSYGRVGHGEEVDVLVPKRISFADVSDSQTVVIKSIALGGFHSLFLEAMSTEKGSSTGDRIGRLFACGAGAPVGLLSEGDRSVIRMPQPIIDKKIMGRGTVITQIAAGMFHSVALFTDGVVAAWGVGSQGRLGNFECKDRPFCAPTFVKTGIGFQNERMFYGFQSTNMSFFDESERVVKDGGEKDKKQTGPKKPDWEIVQFACGSIHTAARTHGGHVFVWGCNANGQLGLGEGATYAWAPTKLNVGNRIVREIACGAEHCLAVTTTQELWAWGKGTDGQLGTGVARDEFDPVPIPTLSQVVTCAAGETHSAAITRPNDPSCKAYKLQCWGSAENGMLGIGQDYMSGSQTTPMTVDFGGLDAGGTRVATAPRAKQASRSRGPQLALPGPANDDTIGPLKVRCGESHTAVILGRWDSVGEESGDVRQVWTFGGGWYGKLGLEMRDEKGHRIPNEGTSSNVYAPQQVNLHGASARDVALGAYHTCMVSESDELWVWGRKGEVCEPDDLRLPKKFSQIEGQPKIKMVVCGELHTIAVTTAGEVWVWGDNRNGQLGRGIIGRDEIRIPIQARMAPGAVEMLATGPGHAIALFVNGETHAWGTQTCGRLGLVDKVYEKIVYEPSKVSAVWCSIESRSLAVASKPKESAPTALSQIAEKESEEEKAVQSSEQIAELLSEQKVTELSTMQSLLKQEDPGHREKSLQDRYDKLRKSLDDIHHEITSLPAMEQRLERLEAEFDQSVRTNLRWFKVSSPENEHQKIDPSFIGRLPFYEKLLFVLQQQTAYLAKLATCVNEEEEPVLYSTVDSLYEHNEGRNRHLLMMLLRQVIDGENDTSSIEDMFRPGRSKAFRMISDYSLSRVHYKDVVRNFMLDQPVNGQETLLMAFKRMCDLSVTFALTLESFKELSDEEMKKKEEQDLRSIYASNMDKLREFLIDPFLKAIKTIELPKDIRQILRHALQAVNNRAWSPAPDPSTPPELRKCEPLMRLFCLGILGPLLRNPGKYASSQCFLDKSAEIIKNDPLIVSNMNCIADFLEQMLDNKLDQKAKLLKSAVKLLKPELLKYLKRQAEGVSYDLETELMVDTYMMHFDRSKHSVRMASADLMKLSNMLKNHMTRLRIQENDELETYCNELLQWSDDKILGAERIAGTNILHNFNMDPRFMFESSDVVICGVSNCLMPARLCGAVTVKEFITAPASTTEDAENPRRVLETLFRELEPIKSRTFKDMQAEFEALRAAERVKNPPSYEMMQNLGKGVKMVGEMLNVEVSPKDLILYMSEQLVARTKYSQYLWNIEKGIEKIANQRNQYIQSLKAWSSELEAALNASVSLNLPATMVKSGGGAANFAFGAINRKMEAQRALGVADPGKMRQIGCSYSPMETYAVSKLKSTGVIVKVHPPFSSMENKMKITIRALANGGVELVVNISQGRNTTQIKTLNISEEKLMEMKRAEKKEQAELGNPSEDPFFTCVGSAFTSLVRKLRENNA